MRDYRNVPVVKTPHRRDITRPKKSRGTMKTACGASPALISKSMIVSDIIALLPEAEKIISEYGLHCFHCSGSALETLDEGCRSHGFADEEIDELFVELNHLLASRPPRPQTLTITAPAARAVQEIATKEGHNDEGLTVIADGHGGFCMEFKPQPEPETKIFTNQEVPTMRFLASPLTLARIGGATIDYREGRFKLDLAEDMKTCECKDDHECKCDI